MLLLLSLLLPTFPLPAPAPAPVPDFGVPPVSTPNCEKKSSVETGFESGTAAAADGGGRIVVGETAGFFVSGLMGFFVAPLGLLGLLRLMPLGFLLPDVPLVELQTELPLDPPLLPKSLGWGSLRLAANACCSW